MDDCIFCKIVRGELPCYKIYEDDNFLAFLNIYPYVEGHTLIIPKKHFRWVWDVENIGEYMAVSAKVANHFKKALNTDYIQCLIMGNEVPHAHIHIIPGNDGKYNEGLNEFTHSVTTPLDKSKADELLSRLKI